MLISVTLLLSFDKTVGYFRGGSHLVNQMFGEKIQTEVYRSLFVQLHGNEGQVLLARRETSTFYSLEQVRGRPS